MRRFIISSNRYYSHSFQSKTHISLNRVKGINSSYLWSNKLWTRSRCIEKGLQQLKSALKIKTGSPKTKNLTWHTFFLASKILNRGFLRTMQGMRECSLFARDTSTSLSLLLGFHIGLFTLSLNRKCCSFKKRDFLSLTTGKMRK
jgi:hypothetical protein